MAEKLDGLGNPIDPGGRYYVQDTAQTVDRCAVWWGFDRKGYTTELERAGTYIGGSVLKARDTDVGWPVDAVLKVAVQHVRIESLRKLGGGNGAQ